MTRSRFLAWQGSVSGPYRKPGWFARLWRAVAMLRGVG